MASYDELMAAFRGCDAEEERERGQKQDDPSAVAASIAARGEQSYYYAHARSDVPQNPAQLAEEEARPKRIAAPTEEDALIAHCAPAVVPVTHFQFADCGQTVKIYVTMPPDQDQVTELSFSELSLLVRMGPHLLEIERLYDKIVGATHKIKREKLIITLQKEQEYPWAHLKNEMHNPRAKRGAVR